MICAVDGYVCAQQMYAGAKTRIKYVDVIQATPRTRPQLIHHSSYPEYAIEDMSYDACVV